MFPMCPSPAREVLWAHGQLVSVQATQMSMYTRGTVSASLLQSLYPWIGSFMLACKGNQDVAPAPALHSGKLTNVHD